MSPERERDRDRRRVVVWGGAGRGGWEEVRSHAGCRSRCEVASTIAVSHIRHALIDVDNVGGVVSVSQLIDSAWYMARPPHSSQLLISCSHISHTTGSPADEQRLVILTTYFADRSGPLTNRRGLPPLSVSRRRRGRGLALTQTDHRHPSHLLRDILTPAELITSSVA